jgi:hypothetical protein
MGAVSASLKITAILSLQTDQDRTGGGIEGERTAADKAGLVFCSVPIEDFNRAEPQICLPDSVAALERSQAGAQRIRPLLRRRELLANCSRGLSVLVPKIRTVASIHPSACMSLLLAGCRGDPRRLLLRSWIAMTVPLRRND